MTKKSEKLKEEVLKYIQDNSMALRAKYQLFDVQLGENPTRLVLVSSREVPLNEFEELSFPVDVQQYTAPAVVATGNQESQPAEVSSIYSSFTKEQQKNLGLTELPNPMTASANNVVNLEAWKKRNKNVKFEE